MARPQSIDLFDAYFRRADLDHDGWISGTEALVFFQGANLPKKILEQWLSRQHKQALYDALKNLKTGVNLTKWAIECEESIAEALPLSMKILLLRLSSGQVWVN